MGKARLITASEEVTGLVDRGYEVDVDIKNLGFEDKGIKKMLADKLEDEFGDDASIVVEGNQGIATIGRSERFVLNGTADEIDGIRDSAESGFLGDAIKTEVVLNVPVADRKRAANILKAAGIDATTVVQLAVDPEEFRVLRDSPVTSSEAADAKKALADIVESKVTYRVSYKKV